MHFNKTTASLLHKEPDNVFNVYFIDLHFVNLQQAPQTHKNHESEVTHQTNKYV